MPSTLLSVTLAMLAVLAVLPGAAFGQTCDNSENQMELNQCFADILKTSDVRLNAAYREIEKRLADDSFYLERLKSSQRAWIAFRDAECRFINARADGGSIFSMLQSQCHTTLTDKRATELESYLSCDETTITCPVPSEP